MADEANVIPLYYVPAAYLTQPYVHSNYFKEGFIRWRTADDWMEKHYAGHSPTYVFYSEKEWLASSHRGSEPFAFCHRLLWDYCFT